MIQVYRTDEMEVGPTDSISEWKTEEYIHPAVGTVVLTLGEQDWQLETDETLYAPFMVPIPMIQEMADRLRGG